MIRNRKYLYLSIIFMMAFSTLALNPTWALAQGEAPDSWTIREWKVVQVLVSPERTVVERRLQRDPNTGQVVTAIETRTIPAVYTSKTLHVGTKSSTNATVTVLAENTQGGWYAISDATMASLAVGPGGNLYALAANKTVYRYSGAGTLWVAVNSVKSAFPR